MSASYNQSRIRNLRDSESKGPGTLQEDFFLSMDDLSEVQPFELDNRKQSRARTAAYPLAAMALDLADLLSIASKS